MPIYTNSKKQIISSESNQLEKTQNSKKIKKKIKFLRKIRNGYD
jgi:hypothetical protein